MAGQQDRVTVQLREMVLNGDFSPGQHITESAVARQFGVSRTPVRHALNVLGQEGLVTGEPNRGFRVARFHMQDVWNALDVRGALEGLAARLVAENGLANDHADALRGCLDTGDRIIEKRRIGDEEISRFGEMNDRFHAIIVRAAGNATLETGLAFANRVPFVAPLAIVIHDARVAKQRMTLAQSQHHLIVEALENGEGSRADALMREHAMISRGSLNLMNEAVAAGTHPRPPALRLIES